MSLLVPDESYLVLFWNFFFAKNQSNLAFHRWPVQPPGGECSPLDNCCFIIQVPTFMFFLGRTGKSFQTKITFSYVCGDPIKTRIDVNTTTSFIVKNNQTKSNFVCQRRRFDLFTILVWCFFASFFNLRSWIIHLSFKVIELNRERRTQTVQMLIVNF